MSVFYFQSATLYLLSDVNCLLTIRFLAHRSAKFDVHPQVHAFRMIVQGRIFPSMNVAKGPPLAVDLLPICTSIATHPSTLVSVYVPWRL